ncbi:hypothetical protein [Aestuariibacter sp. A3R04]|nr:hypothetical protein [Aestuariibacter sp. A3R04]
MANFEESGLPVPSAQANKVNMAKKWRYWGNLPESGNVKFS